MTPLSVLVVDDERISRQTTAEQLQGVGYIAEAAENAYAALKRLRERSWDVVLTDLRMPGMDGLDLLSELRRDFPATAVVLMTAYATVETAVSAMQQGAADYLTKPFSFAELQARLVRLDRERQSKAELSRLRALLNEQCATHGIVGRAPAMDRVRERIQLFASSDAPVVVTGETGTGKELVARAIHAAGPRAKRPFVAIGCGAIPRDLAESELFGHEKGAFTGALARHPGCFEQASGGTLVLDDVDDLPLDIQAKLLRVLQEGTLRRVGGREDVAVDARVIATSKVDLQTAVAERRFRDDLFYRLCGLEVMLPPLRERGDDVLLLAHHFLDVLAGKAGGEAKHISREVAALLRRHTWPGNVRELWRAVESFAALCPGDNIGLAHVPDFLRTADTSPRPYVLDLAGRSDVRLAELVERFEDDVIDWALEQSSGQQLGAAELLGVPRSTLQGKLTRRKKG